MLAYSLWWVTGRSSSIPMMLLKDMVVVVWEESDEHPSCSKILYLCAPVIGSYCIGYCNTMLEAGTEASRFQSHVM